MWRLKITPVDYPWEWLTFLENDTVCINSMGNGDIDTPLEVSQFYARLTLGSLSLATLGPMRSLRSGTP